MIKSKEKNYKIEDSCISNPQVNYKIYFLAIIDQVMASAKEKFK